MNLRGREHDIEMASTNEGARRKELINGGGKGQVPCLRIEDSSGEVTWLYESDDILRYIEKNNLAS